MKLDAESDSEINHVRTSRGPHGYGDPNDTFLRKVEKNVLIPKMIRERSRLEKCTEEVAAFSECAKDAGLLLTFKCQAVNKVLQTCLKKWYEDESLYKECEQQYLRERAEFRQTGLTKKQRAAMQEQSLGS